MAILNIRNLPDEVHANLRVRAAKAGRSMEAEARTILMAVLEGQYVPKSQRKGVSSLAAKRYDELMERLRYIDSGEKFSREEMNARR